MTNNQMSQNYKQAILTLCANCWNLMLYTSTKMTLNNSKTKGGGGSPNVQVMKLSNQSLPHRNDFTSFVMNIFAKTCFSKNYILPSLSTFYNIFDEETSISFDFFTLKKSRYICIILRI
jgi:hypothetical protein